MAEESKPQSWWHTLPGILTATAGVVTAISGLIIALYQAGFFHNSGQVSPQVSTTPSVDVSNPSTAAHPTNNIQPAATSQVAISPTQKVQTKILVQTKQINLLSPENGAHLLAASSDDWTATIDGKEDSHQVTYGLGKEAVYGFKDDRLAKFDTFTMLISATGDNNVKEFELLAGNDSPTGEFESIGKFQTQNLKLFKTPYQEFKFPAVKAKYLKFKLLSTYGFIHPVIYEFQLFGNLKN